MDIRKTDETFNTWANKDFIDDEVKRLVQNADILLVPLEDFREGSGWTFERGTEILYSFLKENLADKSKIEICINNSDYAELSINSNYKRFGKILVKEVIAPTLLALLIAYVEKRLIDDDNNQQIYNITNTVNITSDKVLHNSEDRKKVIAPKKYLESPKAKISIVVISKDKSSKEFNFDGDSKELKSFLKTVEKVINHEEDTLRNRE